jgi:pimeloyl-ACP methyl ester carboxylesterase
MAMIRSPFAGWTLAEPLRFVGEVAALTLSYPLLLAAPRGDGHPVLVLPGFATSDAMTVLLRQYLMVMGHAVHPWELGWNFDQHSVGENGEHIARRIDDIAQTTGRSVSLVGWSLGGVIAREAARHGGHALRQVITLASPFTGNPRATSLAAVYELFTGNDLGSAATKARYADAHTPLPVPASAIYSKTDGITAWENCLAEEGPQSENIAVCASHFGMVAHPAVLWALADRLALPEGGWRKFAAGGPFAAAFG